MATFVDVSGLTAFSNIFAFLFTVVIVYALLTYTRALGGNMVVSVLIAILIGIFVLISSFATNIVLEVAPWFAVIFVFAVLSSMAFGSFGASTNIPAFQGLKAVTLVFFIVIMVLLALGKITSSAVPSTTTTGTTSTSGSVGLSLITDPRVFGVIIIGLISVFTIALLTTKSM